MLSSCQRRARAQNDFATSQSDGFAAPGFRLALGKFGLPAEFRFKAGGLVNRRPAAKQPFHYGVVNYPRGKATMLGPGMPNPQRANRYRSNSWSVEIGRASCRERV